MKTILLVEDERRIAEIAEDYLTRAGFTVVVAGDGASALALVRARKPDLMVLDLGLPKVDGLEVTRTVRRESSVPIIMLTARVEEDDRLLGLELGADDYITKPFSPRELVARVQAVLRRASSSFLTTDTIRVGDLTLDVPRLKVRRGESSLDLTATEFRLLMTMARQPGRVFTRAQLLDSVRDDGEAFDRAIDTHIKNIRRKIEPDPRAPRYIETVYGIGYRCAEQ
jgi:two-component system alkaline phosphatase synthesis response regulator PhoP